MFEFKINNDNSHIHFIGIGGISMSGLAEILLTEGYKVSGSDYKNSPILDRLRSLDAEIYIGHSENNINNPALVVYTDAISSDNEELKKAISLNIPVVDRATFLGALMKNYEKSIAVSGTHGKTTTTSMISTILNHSTINPTILLGGELKDIGGNVKLGSRDCILTEACEYKANILKYFPTMVIVLNMDEDHLDYFKNMDHIVETFKSYINNLEEDAHLLINADDPNYLRVISETKAKVFTFGIENEADYMAKNIRFSKEGYPSYDLFIKGQGQHTISLNVLGTHNIYNSLASIAATHLYGMDIKEIIKNLNIYDGVGRRLDFKGHYKGAKVIDDYAHHPTEIRASLNAIKQEEAKGKVYCIFQPHTFTRTQILFDSFAKSFYDADEVIITDIYGAREVDKGAIHSRDLANAIVNVKSTYLESFEDIKSYLKEKIVENDIIITMGAGNIVELGEELIREA